jgi:hypothetical protein
VSGTTFSLEYTGAPEDGSVYLPHELTADVVRPYRLRLLTPSLVTLTLYADISLAAPGLASVSVNLAPRVGEEQSQTFNQSVPIANTVQALSSTLQTSLPAGTYAIHGAISGPSGTAISVDARLDIQVIRST